MQSSSDLTLVKIIAKSIAARLPYCVDVQDLENAGYLGLHEAISKFDDSKGIPFVSYAKHRIRGSILDYLRGVDPLTRDQRKAVRKAETAWEYIRAGMDEESALQASRISKKDYTMGLQLLSMLPNFRGETDPDHADPAPNPEQTAQKTQLKNTLLQAIDRLPERYALLFRMYYFEENTLLSISKVLGVNEARASQIHQRGLELLREDFSRQPGLL